jgi:Rps23 Pro-64 3,4-dihydroxylase Tpa1-like proline 4-hydroxylase
MQSLMKLKNCIDSPQLTHVLCSNDDPALSNAFKVFIPLLSALSDLDELIRIKLNLTYPVYTEAEYSTPHCDIFQIENHQTAIYYINDSDGDTVIFNEKYETNTTYDKLTIKQKITPKQGRLVIFNGMYLHAAGIPRNSECRMVANINFLAKNNA